MTACKWKAVLMLNWIVWNNWNHLNVCKKLSQACLKMLSTHFVDNIFKQAQDN